MSYYDRSYSPSLQGVVDMSNAVIVPSMGSVNSSLATGGTIATAGMSVSPVNPAAAVTGAVLQAGAANGQSVKVVNESANTITFAASGTSNTADGTGDVIPASAAREFVWLSATSLWYRLA